jgi:DNA-binding response OmpR family regulator
MQLGADAWLAKSFQLDEFENMVRSVVPSDDAIDIDSLDTKSGAAADQSEGATPDEVIGRVTAEKGGVVASGDETVKFQIPPGAVLADLSIHMRTNNTEVLSTGALRLRLRDKTVDILFMDKAEKPVAGLSLHRPAIVGMLYEFGNGDAYEPDSQAIIQQFTPRGAVWDDVPTSFDNMSMVAATRIRRLTPPVSREDPLVLAIKDNPDTAAMLTDALEGVGFEVSIEAKGDRAFQHAGQSQPSIIILSNALTRFDGMRILRQIKSDYRVDRIPIIMFAPGACADMVQGLWRWAPGA